MTAPECATGCKRPSPSAIICAGCQASLHAALTMAADPEFDVNLLDAVARQLKHGHGGRSASAEPPLPYDPAASDAARNLRLTMAAAMGRIDYPARRQWPPGVAHTISAIASHLAERVGEIAQHPLAAEMYHDIRHAVDRCVRLLDGPPATVYAGPCPGCGADLLGVPGVPLITCRCGRPADVRLQQDAMRAVLEDRLFTAAQLVSMAAALGCPVSEYTVRSWVRRHQLVPRGTRPRGHGEPSATYRFGDLLDLASRRQRVKG